MTTRRFAIGLSALLFTAWAGGWNMPAAAAEEEESPLEDLMLKGEHCVSLKRIDRTHTPNVHRNRWK